MVFPFPHVIFAFLGALGLALCSAQEQLPEPGSFTANELLAKANAAFAASDFPQAEVLFLAFERDFGEEPELKEIAEKNTALIALCKITNGRAAEAGPFIERALKLPRLPRDILEELSFWDAIQKLQNEDYRSAQMSFGSFFQQRDFTYSRRLESLILFGTCYLLQGYHQTAAEFFSHQIPKLRQAPGGSDYAARAVVLQMMSLVEAQQFDDALRLLTEEYPRLGEITQLISFQTLALSLGSHYMEQEKYHAAIACLQRIWPKDRLLRHQQEKLAELKEKRTLAAADFKMQSLLFQIDGTIKRIERELENFAQIKDFDAALRLRLAIAFQGLERYREAALIMEDILQRMESSPTVESASLAVIQCWSQMERWPKALQAAENYLQSFGNDRENKNLPRVLFMQADALMQMQMNADAESVFATIASSFPDHDLVPKALFMKGFCQMLQDHNPEAMASFDEVLKKGEKGEMAQDALYWKGMAMSFNQNYTECFAHMSQYLEKFRGDGLKYEPEAEFRKAYSTFCEADYPGAISQFRKFLADYGTTSQDRDEAWLLLGDALLGEGEADAGIAAYQSINPASTRFFEDGYFKTGKAYKLLEESLKLRTHYENFLRDFPESNKMPEAVYWIGWTYVHSGDLKKAKEVYWSTLNEHGDKPELFSIEELFLALPKVYKRGGPREVAALARELQILYFQAEKEKKNTLAVRALWATAMIKQQEGEGSEAGVLLRRLATLINPEIHNPQIVADIADSLAAAGDLETASRLYLDLKKWNPASFHKARAFKGLAQIAERGGKVEDAIQHYRDYEKAAANSTDLAEIIIRRITLEMEKDPSAAPVKELEPLLENPASSPQHKAQTLFLIGNALDRQGEKEKATAYFERVYVVYGKYRDLVAQAYLRRAEILESLGRPDAAFEVYSELAAREDLQSFEEARKARDKAESLKSFAPAPASPPPAPPQ